MLGEGRISTRCAAVITYALSLLLRSIVVADRQAQNEPSLDPVLPPFQRADANKPPSTPDEAIANYERLRS
jgi:hypothetical protein